MIPLSSAETMTSRLADTVPVRRMTSVKSLGAILVTSTLTTRPATASASSASFASAGPHPPSPAAATASMAGAPPNLRYADMASLHGCRFRPRARPAAFNEVLRPRTAPFRRPRPGVRGP